MATASQRFKTGATFDADELIKEGHRDGFDLTIVEVFEKQYDDGPSTFIRFEEDERFCRVGVQAHESFGEAVGNPDDDFWIGAVVNVYPCRLPNKFKGRSYTMRARKSLGVGPAGMGAAPQQQQLAGPPPTAPRLNPAVVNKARQRLGEMNATDSDLQRELLAMGVSVQGAMEQWPAIDMNKIKAALEAIQNADAIDEDSIPF